MGYTIAYRRFISVRVREAGSDRGLRDLRFTPTPACRRELDRHQLIFRHRAYGLDLYYATYPDARVTLPAPIASRTRFSFSIGLSDPGFFNRYQPGAAAPLQFYLDNLDSSGAIVSAPDTALTAAATFGAADGAVFRGQTFSQRTAMPAVDPPTAWRISAPFPPGDTLQTVAVHNPDNLDYVTVRINDPIRHEAEYLAEAGPYRLATDRPAPPETLVYLSDHLRGRADRGVLDLYWESAQDGVPADTGLTYQILFQPI